MLKKIEWRVQNGHITKNIVLPPATCVSESFTTNHFIFFNNLSIRATHK